MEKDNESNKPSEEVVENAPVNETPASEGSEKPEAKSEEKESVDFDPSAFSDVKVVNTEVEKPDSEITEGAAASEEGKETIPATEEKPVDAQEGLEWVTDEVIPTEEAEAPKPDEVIPADKPVDEAPKKVSDDSFKQFSDELGLKFETMDEMKEHLKAIEEENNQLRNASGSGAKNEAINSLESLLNKENEDLVRLSLEKDGFSGEELDDAVDRYIDNGLIDIEAKKIRNTISNAIVNEQNKITQSTVDADAKQQQEYAESVRKLEEHISKTETMFGFKMAKDPESLKQVQQGHAEYIKSGKFMDDVFANDESLAEAAWFVRNKKVIINAIANKNLQKGKQSILDDIREPEVVSPQRFRDPEGSDEFDPKMFGDRN